MDISLLNVGPQAGLIITLFVIAIMQLIRKAFRRDFEAVAIIIGAGIAGGVVALAVDGVSLVVGVAYGLGASGLITALGANGKNSSDTNVAAGHNANVDLG